MKGRQLKDDPQMTALINKAYLDRYSQPENIPYARGITQLEYAEYNMEFIYPYK